MPAPRSPEGQARSFSMTVTHTVTRGHSENAFPCCLFVLGLSGKEAGKPGREEAAWSYGISGEGRWGTGWEGSLPRALALAWLLPGCMDGHGGPVAEQGRRTEGHLPLLPLTSLRPSFQVCYDREILGCILIKQWNFYFFFS